MKTTPFTIFSYCEDEPQVFVDTIFATSLEQAEAQVQRNRPYATLDSGETTSGFLKRVAAGAKKTPYFVRVGEFLVHNREFQKIPDKQRVILGWAKRTSKVSAIDGLTTTEFLDLLNAFDHAATKSMYIHALAKAKDGWQILKIGRTGVVKHVTAPAVGRDLVAGANNFLYSEF